VEFGRGDLRKAGQYPGRAFWRGKRPPHSSPARALFVAGVRWRPFWIRALLLPVRLGPPCRRPILIATKDMLTPGTGHSRPLTDRADISTLTRRRGRAGSPSRPVLRWSRKFRATNAYGPLGDRTQPGRPLACLPLGSLDIWKTEIVLLRSMPDPTNVQTPAVRSEMRPEI